MGVAQVRQSVGKVSHMEHWFGSAAIAQNISFTDLNNDGPQCDLRQFPTEMFILNEKDWQNITYNFSILSSRVLVNFFPWLKVATSSVSQPIADMPDAMKIKNDVIPLPVMHKNEQKYSDVVDILASYQDICESTYMAAGKAIDKVYIGGDQLTRERFSGAKRLRAAALTETERFEALYPITFEVFHLQMAVLTLYYQMLYDEYHTDIFTLHCQRIRLLRKDANGQDVKNHYDSCKELAISVIKAYIVLATCEQFEMPNLNFKPDFVPELDTMTDEQKKEWLISKASPIVCQVTSTSRNVTDGTLVEDASPYIIYNYSNILVELCLVFLELCDIVKNPNRKRFKTSMKYLMIVMKGHDNKSKCALEILRLLCQQFALLSERAANKAVYGLFVNTGKTIIPVDLQMEHLVKLTKGHLRTMCSNVTDASLVKRSSTFWYG
ncbi:uncharacterized protein LOC123550437 [Mercenaria mercenaria]|uniref:uncharacterized protein LOC123550437 n=1 Tax=Mercenaria mercenaria TaxID=6596 RepID=UPI00234FA6F8|nr:uncharacterized protein LOC123550437 [Mercenaria mercenaria]